MSAIPHDEVAVSVLAPAASEPMAALMALCSLSTGTKTVSTLPSATKLEKYCGTSVEGVMGNAGITSGLIWRIAMAMASFPDKRSLIFILLPS